MLKRSAPQSEGGGVTTYRYDADGNLAERLDPDGGRWWFHWNGAGQLAQVDRPGGTAVTFRYDAFGRRVEKNADGVVTRWVWDGNVPLHEWRSEADAPEVLRTPEMQGRRKGLLGVRARLGDDAAWAEALRKQAEDEEFGWIVQELLDALEAEPEEVAPDEDGVVTWSFEAESFSPLARVSEKRGAMAVFTDHLGTPLCLTDAAGEVAWQGVTDTFGRCEAVTGDAALCPWRFPGQYEDAETGLFYNRFRYYSAEVGGYVSRDPIGLAGGLAVHGYVDDPLTFTDFFGLSSEDCGLKRDLRKQLRHIEELAASPGLSGTTRALDRRQVRKVAEAFLGPGHTVAKRGRQGELWMESADGRRMVRMPTQKGSEYARTGTQANFHERQNTRTDWFDNQGTSNVHVNVT